jgi:hypothetical protein
MQPSWGISHLRHPTTRCVTQIFEWPVWCVGEREHGNYNSQWFQKILCGRRGHSLLSSPVSKQFLPHDYYNFLIPLHRAVAWHRSFAEESSSENTLFAGLQDKHSLVLYLRLYSSFDTMPYLIETSCETIGEQISIRNRDAVVAVVGPLSGLPISFTCFSKWTL